MIKNAKPTGDDCPKCGNPNTMYWCTKCEQNQEEDGLCNDCSDHVVVDEAYHLYCSK